MTTPSPSPADNPARLARAVLAQQRLPQARAAFRSCRLCHHLCGVNRLQGELGKCKAGPAARVYQARVETGDELELIPAFAIAFSGCDLRCSFCNVHLPSWNPSLGEEFDPVSLGTRAAAALAAGAKSVMILGGEPTIHLPSVLQLVAALPAAARLIWKTNGHGTHDARRLLDGLFDVWLVDAKFGNDTCAAAVGAAPGYVRAVRENLLWARSHSELMVRHLVVPGHVECCWRPVARQ